MSLFDYLFPLLLIFSVVRQVRGKHLNWFQLAWPLALVIWAAVEFLRGFPLTGSNLALVVATTVTGCALGTLAGVFTRVYRRADGALMARATAATVVLWIAGTIGRLVFGLYAEHGGGPAIAAFSHAHGISFGAGGGAWGAALILMALCEVVGRTVVLGVRALGGGSRGGGPGGVQEARVSSRPALQISMGFNLAAVILAFLLAPWFPRRSPAPTGPGPAPGDEAIRRVRG